MKKFLASLLGVVVFFLLVPTCTIFIARDFMSEKTIGEVLDIAPELIDEESEGKGLSETLISELESIDPIFAKQLDEERLQEELVKFITSVFETLGNPKSEYIFDTTGIKEYLKEAVNKYEEESGVTISEEDFNELFKSIDEINKTKAEFASEYGDLVTIFEILYSKEILITLISLIVLCIIIMFILLRDISITLFKVKTPFLVNGIGTILVGGGFASVLNSIKTNTESLPTRLINVLTLPFYKIGFICIGIAIILIIISKVLKHNRSISNSNAALENLGNENYIPNTNITNTPYNGYQNH